MILCSMLALFLICIYYVFFSQNKLLISQSPSKEYEVIVDYKDGFLFGPQEVNIYCRKKTSLFKQNIIRTYLYNDGQTPNKHNCKIVWEDGIAKIILSDKEKNRLVYTIDTNRHNKVRKIQ